MGEAGHDGKMIDIQAHSNAVNGHSAVSNGRSQAIAGATTDATTVDLDAHNHGDDQPLLGEAMVDDLSDLNTGYTLKMQQLKAMFMKRFYHSLRNTKAIIVQLLLPMIFVLIALIVAKTFPGPKDSPSRELFDLSRSYDSNTLLYTSRADSSTAGSALSNSLASNLTALIPEGQNKQYYQELPTTGKPWNSLSQFILNTIGDKPQDVAEFNKVNMVGVMFAPDSKINATVLPTAVYNGQAYHSISQALAWADAAIIRSMQVASGAAGAAWSYANAPLPRTPQERAQDQQDNIMGFTTAFNILFGMAFLASSFVVFLVTERSNKAKHIQFVSGVNAISYWGAAYVWDFVNYLIPTVGCLILFVAFKVDAYSGDRLAIVALLFVLYGFAVLPTMYLCR